MKTGCIIAAAVMLNVAAWAANVEYPGFVKVENFDNIAGDPVGNMLTAPKYTNNQPDSITFLNSLYWSRTPAADNYGSRITGFITAPETGEYVFYIASDNDSWLYLSTDSTPANLKFIAADQGWQNARTWTGGGGMDAGQTPPWRRGNRTTGEGPYENRSDQFLTSPLGATAGPGTPRWPTTNSGGNAVISLVANQKYYFQYLFKEGGGGDNAGVAWKRPSDPTDPDIGSPEILGTDSATYTNLSVIWSDTLSFQTQPTNQTVSEGQIVNFRAVALGVPGDSDTTLFTYEWYVNNVLDPAATTATYTILSAATGDSGKQFKLVVTSQANSSLTATSAVATLTVVSDPVPPRISRIRSSDSFASAKITFSEAVRNEAVDPANYVFGGGLTVSDANFDIVADTVPPSEDPKNPLNPLNRVAVILFTSTQTTNTTYALTVNNVKDLIGNNLAPNNTTTMYGQVFQPGILSYKRWMGGGNIQALVDNQLRFADPDVDSTFAVAETPGFGDQNIDYVARLNGFFIPTVTTNYVFLMCADNDGYLFLSTDANVANRKLIGADVGWQNQRVWTGPGGDAASRRGDGVGGGPFENRSDELLTSARATSGANLPFGGLPLVPADSVDPEPWPTTNGSGNAVITLTAGQRYAFQLWHQEFDSGRVEATFKFDGEADPAIGAVSRITSGLIGAYVDPSSLLPTITVQPTNVNFTVGGTINFNVTATSFSQPITYQWFKNGNALAGQTNSSLTINNAAASDLAAYYVAVSNENGPVNSTQVLALTTLVPPGLTFQEDGTGMTVIEAEHYFSARTATDGHLWVPQTGRADSSGNGYMTLLPDSGVNAGNANYPNLARLDIRVAFTTAGIHYLWLRGGDPRADGAGDSVHAGINDTVSVAGTQITGAPTFNTLAWNWVGTNNAAVKVSVDVPSAGTHTVNLWMREDGFLFDKLIVTTDAAYTPTGTGPAESAQVSAGPSLAIGRNGANLVITYTGTLLSAPTVNGTYTPVAGASGGSYTTSPTNSQQYFRAQQ